MCVYYIHVFKKHTAGIASGRLTMNKCLKHCNLHLVNGSSGKVEEVSRLQHHVQDRFTKLVFREVSLEKKGMYMYKELCFVLIRVCDAVPTLPL